MAQTLTSYWLARGRGVVDTGLTPAQSGKIPANALTNKSGSIVLTNKSGTLVITRKAA